MLKVPEETYCSTPCGNCPWRKDSLKGWLGYERAKELLQSSGFVCHKTKHLGKRKRQCAGHMLLLGDQNSFVSTARALNLDLDIQGRHLVFDTVEQAIEHHSTL